ncbi:hypothetical protein F5Y16DRAFT_308313 [Xylariaceae sp. FL0255]|nr:hypothetical protein F5Y16DRAFT_308313 [Xylariaceae sp. FL0255]
MIETMAYPQGTWGSAAHYMPMMSSTIPSLPNTQTHLHQNSHEPSPKSLEKYTLSFMQQPQHAKAANGKDKDRRPVDPPPILKLEVAPDQDPDGVYKQSPYLIVVAYLEYSPGQEQGQESMPPANLMSGTMVSSLHRLKDPGDQEGAFFVFGDLTIRREGTYCLRFDLLQMEFGMSSDPDSLVTVTSVTSNPFRVYSQKTFPKQHKNESTFLTRSFSDQGVRLRVRKDSRLSLNRKRNDKVIERLDRKRLASDPAGQNRRALGLHRTPLETTEHYYDGELFSSEPMAKRHRTGSGPTHIISTSATAENNLEARSWGSYQQNPNPYSHQGPLAGITTGPPISTSMSAPHMLPPTTRLDTHFSPLHTSSGIFTSPVGERQSPLAQSPMHQSPYGSTGSQGSSMAYLYGSSAAGQNTSHAHQAGMNTPSLSNSSPRSHGQGTTSPIGGVGMYTAASAHTPHHPRQVSYSTPAYHNMGTAFDHSTLHEQGMSTPLTGNMPPENLKGSYHDVYNGVSKSS